MKAILLATALVFSPSPSPALFCNGAVHWSNDPKFSSYIDCEDPCANSCAAFLVSTPCGDGAQCGCSTSGPNLGPDAALVPPSTTGRPCPVGTCPNGQPPEILNEVHMIGPGRFEFIGRADCP